MRVVIVGSGIAGSAAAVALRRVGAEVTVYERHEDPAGPVGSWVSLAHNGLRALDAPGCLDAVRRAGFDVPWQRMWSGAGRALATVPRGRPAGDPLNSVTLRRADLLDILRTAAREAGARVEIGSPVMSDADPRLHGADVVIGADGIRSATRRWLDPVAPTPTYAGVWTASGQSDLPADLSPDALAPGTFHFTFARRGAFLHLPAPDGTVWWSAQVATSAPDRAAVTPDTLAATFDHEPVAAAILRHTREITSVTSDEVLGPVNRRYDDQRVLIGDAAHPVGVGQGAAMAIEDAIVLARELGRAPTVADALRSFDTLRYERLHKLARMATANRDAKTSGPIARRIRDVVLPVVFPRVYPRATRWLYTYDVGTLPDVEQRSAA